MKVRNEDNKDNKKNNEQKYQVKNESDSQCVQINKPRVLFIVFFSIIIFIIFIVLPLTIKKKNLIIIKLINIIKKII